MFKRLKLQGWRQIDSLDIKFHPRLTVITGPNGSGKSTALSILIRHFGYSRNLLSTPRQTKAGVIERIFSLFKSVNANIDGREVGEITYSNDQVSKLSLPNETDVTYSLLVSQQLNVTGIHIDSHRPISTYKKMQILNLNAINIDGVQVGINHIFQQYYNNGTRPGQDSVLDQIKMHLLYFVMFGYDSGPRVGTKLYREYFEEFQEILKKTLPKDLGYTGISIVNNTEIVLNTVSGNFLIDACSGGILKIIEVTWQIFFQSKAVEKFVVTMDEPENHLHPSMQRTFLSDLVEAFPTAQFIVASHSPFIVTSVRDSSVYVLRYLDSEYEERGGATATRGADDLPGVFSGRRIRSEHLDTVNRAGTASEILREVLGVPATIPEWAGERAKEIVESYRGKELTSASLDAMHDELKSEGLVSEYPTAVFERSRDPS